MVETFLILLSGGIMLAAALSDPRAVTLAWLRLAGILALCMGGLALFFYHSGETHADMSRVLRNVQVGLMWGTIGCVLAQLAFVQIAWRGTQRFFAASAFVVAVLAGTNVLHEMMLAYRTSVAFPPKSLSMTLQTLACAGVSAMSGIALMDMLLGHAYLTASKMTIAPFRRLNALLAGAIVYRALLAIALAMTLQQLRPVYLLWGAHGLFILTRWLVGLAVPAVFVYMAHDCIKRRSTQSATGILYVAGVLIFIGEIVALHLVRATGLPF